MAVYRGCLRICRAHLWLDICICICIWLYGRFAAYYNVDGCSPSGSEWPCSETPRFCRGAPARRSKEIQSALAGINSSAASCPVGGGAQPQAQEQKEQARQAGSDDGGEAAAEELSTTSGRPPEQDAWSVIDIELC